MPAHATRRAQPGGRLLTRLQPFDHGECRHLRIGDDRKAADVGHVRRRDIHRSAKLLGPLHGVVNVVDFDIADPMRRRAPPCGLLRHAHEPGDGRISSCKKAIG